MVIDIHETKRDIKASVAGTTGLDAAAADNIIANYGTGIKNEDGQLVNAATTDIGSKAVAGPTSETANGRTIGNRRQQTLHTPYFFYRRYHISKR